MAKILVTGGTGYVGANLVVALAKGRHQITIFASQPMHPFLKDLNIRIIQGDIRDQGAVESAIKGKDYVYHLAATAINDPKRRKDIFDINVLGTESVMRAALKHKVKKVVYTSSSAALGFSKNEVPLDEKNFLDEKDNLYGISKKNGEDIVLEYVKKGLNAVIVMPCYVVGAGEVDPQRYGLWKSIHAGRIRFTYPGGGGTVAIEDLVEGIMLAMKKGKAAERYNLCSGYIRLFDFYNLIAKEMGSPGIRWKIPRMGYYPAYFLAAILEKLLKSPPITREAVRWHFNYKMPDSSKARKELGWDPNVQLRESVQRAIAYYKKIGVLP